MLHSLSTTSYKRIELSKYRVISVDGYPQVQIREHFYFARPVMITTNNEK
jgi:hypothetical protein